jgi:hypothetical protein
MADFSRQLRTLARRNWTQCFQQSVDDVQQLVQAAPKPFDTGDLESGIDKVFESPIGVIKEAQFRSTTTSRGTDYPAILETEQVITPNPPNEYLRFQVRGNWVQTKMIQNRHYRWWTNMWGADTGSSLWIQALRRNFK